MLNCVIRNNHLCDKKAKLRWVRTYKWQFLLSQMHKHFRTSLIKKPFDQLKHWILSSTPSQNCLFEKMTRCCCVSNEYCYIIRVLFSFLLQDCCCLPALECFRANLNLQFKATEKNHIRFYKSLQNPLTVSIVPTQARCHLHCPKLFWQLSSFHPFQKMGLDFCNSQSGNNVSRNLQSICKKYCFARQKSGQMLTVCFFVFCFF